MEDSHQDAHARGHDGQISSACSFEVLDPHDPVISRLATQLFMKTNDYLQGEMAAGQEHYAVLEEINRQGITKFADLRNFVSNLSKTVYEYEKLCEQQIKPLLDQIDEIEVQVSLVEQKAYQLDAYTKQLYNLHKEILDNSVWNGHLRPGEERWVSLDAGGSGPVALDINWRGLI